MFIVTVGLNYKTCPVKIREKVCFSEDTLNNSLMRLKNRPTVEGCVILSTCNRSEIYVATTDVEQGLGQVKTFLCENSGLPLRDIEDYLYVRTIYDAIRHLFKVVSGLDSMILGETQILGQVRDAYQSAFNAGVTNPVLNTFFQQALTVGKKVRTETGIDRHAVSISYAAVEMVRQKLADLHGKEVLVIGAGEMSELTLLHMISNGVGRVVVANRSFQRAEELADKYQGRAVYFEEINNALLTADIVISATAAPGYIITEGQVKEIMAVRGDKPLYFIDIAVPRDIEPEVCNIPGVMLSDIDDLCHVVDRNLEERRQAAVRAEKLIEEEIESFLQWLGSRFMVPTIAAFQTKLETIKDEELERALNRLNHLSGRELKVVQTLANAIVHQIMHAPVVNLKEYATTHQGHLYAEIFQNLFDLQVEGQRQK